jgi:hypothetical protein
VEVDAALEMGGGVRDLDLDREWDRGRWTGERIPS